MPHFMRRFHFEKKPDRQRVNIVLDSGGRQRKVGGGELVANPKLLPERLQALLKGRKLAKINLGLEEEFQRHPYRHRGLGTRLAHTLEKMAREKGFRALVTFITPSDRAGIRLAKKLGYRHLEGSNYYFKNLGGKKA